MAKIYINQTSLTLKLDTGVDISTATTRKIQYNKPDGTAGELVGILEGTTIVKYNFTSSVILDQAGTWIFWAFITFTDGRTAPGTPVEIVVYEKGS